MPPLPRLGALRSLTGTTATESSATALTCAGATATAAAIVVVVAVYGRTGHRVRTGDVARGGRVHALLAAERVVAGTRPRSRRTGAAVGGRRAACARLLALARLTLMGASSGILRTAAGVAAVTGLVGTRAGEGAALS